MKFFFVLVFTFTVILGIAAFQNDAEVTLKFLKWEFSYNIILVLAVTLGLGLLSGIAMTVPAVWKKAKVARTHKRRVHELEEEIAKEPEPDEQSEEAEETEEDIEQEEAVVPAEVREKTTD